MALVACAPMRDFDAELDRDLIHIENSSAVRVRGDLPDDILFEEFQAVVYRSDSVKNRIPYKLNIGPCSVMIFTSGPSRRRSSISEQQLV